jgi:signal transduction histidine kinase
MVVLVVTLVGITALLIGSLSYRHARDALRETAKSRLRLLARDIAEHLHGELDDRVADITGWAHLEVMMAVLYQDVDKELAQFVTRSLQGRRIYRAVVCFDRNGEPVAEAGQATGIVPPRDLGGRSRITIAPTSSGGSERMLRFETAIVNPQSPDESIGAMVVLLDSERVRETIDASVQGGPAPAALLVTSPSGQIVMRTGPVPDAATASAIRAEESVISATADVGTIMGVDAPQLQILVWEETAVALARASELKAALIRTGLVVLVLSAGMGALVAWRIVVPVRALTVRVQEIAARGEVVAGPQLPDADGEVGVLSTAFRAMTESLARAQQESLAQSRLALVGEVAASVAHEVRTPLSVLKASAQMLGRSDLPGDQQRKLAMMVAEEVDRLNRVVSALVDLAKPKAVRRRPEALGPIISRALAFFAPMAGKRGVEIRSDLGDGEAVVVGSNDQLYQVLLNLVHNALQAMDEEGVLTVSSRNAGGTVTVEVADTGPGFAEDVLPRIFSPFFTTKADGTGLGLVIVKRIIEEHGGTTGARNRPTGGAVVWFRLPQRDGA